MNGLSNYNFSIKIVFDCHKTLIDIINCGLVIETTKQEVQIRISSKVIDGQLGSKGNRTFTLVVQGY